MCTARTPHTACTVGSRTVGAHANVASANRNRRCCEATACTSAGLLKCGITETTHWTGCNPATMRGLCERILRVRGAYRASPRGSTLRRCRPLRERLYLGVYATSCIQMSWMGCFLRMRCASPASSSITSGASGKLCRRESRDTVRGVVWRRSEEWRRCAPQHRMRGGTG